MSAREATPVVTPVVDGRARPGDPGLPRPLPRPRRLDGGPGRHGLARPPDGGRDPAPAVPAGGRAADRRRAGRRSVRPRGADALHGPDRDRGGRRSRSTSATPPSSCSASSTSCSSGRSGRTCSSTPARRCSNGSPPANLPNPRIVADHLAPLADEGRLGLVSFHDDEQELFDRFAIDAHMPAPGPGDAFSLVTSNGGHNKIDVYQERSVRYDVELDPRHGDAGRVGDDRADQRGAQPRSPAGGGRQQRPGVPGGDQRGARQRLHPASPGRRTGGRCAGRVPLEPGAGLLGVRHARADPRRGDGGGGDGLRGASGPPSSSYALQYLSQPLVNPDEVEVTLHVADGWRFEESEQLRAQGGFDGGSRHARGRRGRGPRGRRSSGGEPQVSTGIVVDPAWPARSNSGLDPAPCGRLAPVIRLSDGGGNACDSTNPAGGGRASRLPCLQWACSRR